MERVEWERRDYGLGHWSAVHNPDTGPGSIMAEWVFRPGQEPYLSALQRPDYWEVIIRRDKSGTLVIDVEGTDSEPATVQTVPLALVRRALALYDAGPPGVGAVEEAKP